MEFKLNHRREIGVQLYLNKTIRLNGVSQLMLPSLLKGLMVVMGGGRLCSQILLSGPKEFANFPLKFMQITVYSNF